MRPYVRELTNIEDEFCSQEEDLCGYTPDASKKDNTMRLFVYMTDWYKCKYINRAKEDYQKTFGGKKLDQKKS